ncbi:MAG: hypothetical protein COS37_01425 [Anaerolineae bacterium CG03_land_8_20_14_0_80_58_20]|nr:MAG: hypothetical protein AUJ21_01850 [Anaerolineae bacterium CG1_02_58_13]PIV28177.1 MAG: hypothetical protein COS37_01425 [Anaerolineae bacterium CG03_land_8_20_14_0_80_58_20]
MAIGQVTWTQLYALARRTRLAGATRQPMDIHLSPEESIALADVLEAALRMMTAVMSRPELDLSEPSADELVYLAMEGGAFDWLADEPDLYSDDDLKERFEWPTA